MKLKYFTSKFHIPVSIKPQPTKFQKFFTDPCLIIVQWIRHYLTTAANAIHDGLVAPLRDIWDNHYPGVANMQRRVVMPQSTFSFIITIMVAFAEIKSQGQPGFPFKTHLLLVRFSIAIVLMYGFSCAVELVVSDTSVSAVIARLGKLVCLCILVASLACLLFL